MNTEIKILANGIMINNPLSHNHKLDSQETWPERWKQLTEALINQPPNQVYAVDFKKEFRKFVDKQIENFPGWYR